MGSKADCLANYINQIVREVGLKCVSKEGASSKVKNRFEIAILGYGKDSSVYSAFQGPLSYKKSGGFIHGIKNLFDAPYSYVENKPIWITSSACHKTPMTEAFNTARDVIESWINWGNHYESHPPILINITDGIPTDSGHRFELLIDASFVALAQRATFFFSSTSGSSSGLNIYLYLSATSWIFSSFSPMLIIS